MENNAQLNAFNVKVDGNIQSEKASKVKVFGDFTVIGSIQIKCSGSADIKGVKIDGDLQFDENFGFLNASNNIIGGNLQAFQNVSGTTITNNKIDGNLQCKGNNPSPTGWDNIVNGSIEDQCKFSDNSQVSFLFNWLEDNFSELLSPSPQPNRISDGLVWRYYQDTHVCIVTFQDHLYFLDGLGNLWDLGEVDDWLQVIF